MACQFLLRKPHGKQTNCIVHVVYERSVRYIKQNRTEYISLTCTMHII